MSRSALRLDRRGSALWMANRDILHRRDAPLEPGTLLRTPWNLTPWFLNPLTRGLLKYKLTS